MTHTWWFQITQLTSYSHCEQEIRNVEAWSRVKSADVVFTDSRKRRLVQPLPPLQNHVCHVAETAWCYSYWETIGHWPFGWRHQLVCAVHVRSQHPAFTQHVRTTSAAGLSVSRHHKAHLRCSGVVELFNVCWPPAHRDIPSASCLIWSVGVCSDCRGTSGCCRWMTFWKVQHCRHHVLDELFPPNSDNQLSQHILRKWRHKLTLPEKKGHLAAKNFIIRLLYKETYWLYLVFATTSLLILF